MAAAEHAELERDLVQQGSFDRPSLYDMCEAMQTLTFLVLTGALPIITDILWT